MEAVLEHDANEAVFEKRDVMSPATVQEHLSTPEGAPYFQFINGEAIYCPTPPLLHQQLLQNVILAMDVFVSPHDLGEMILSPVDLYFNDKELFMPDISFVSHERKHIMTAERLIGAPDLVAEILSPSTGYYDLTHKKFVYEQEGVREYWLVYPDERRIEIYTNSDDGFQIHSQARAKGAVKSLVLSGLELSIDAVFE
jgi:Uma2 family endonuclease